MKICFFGTYFYKYSRNAVLRNGLRRNGHTVVELHSKTRKHQLESSKDVSVISFLRLFISKLIIYKALIVGYKKVKNSDLVVVLYPGYLVLPLAWTMCLIFRKKLIFDSFTSVYDTLVNDRKLFAKNSYKAKGIRLAESILLKLPDQVFVDTELMRNYITNEFSVSKNKMFVIPVGSDDTIYFPSKLRRSQTVNVVWFGGYSPLQGVKIIVSAIKKLNKYNLIKFKLIGEGFQKQEILEYAAKNSLRNVEFIGLLSESALAKYIRNSDIVLGIFANNSMARRVIPNKVYAGISSNKAVITASLPPVKNVFVNKKNIIFSKAEDPSDLADRILQIAKDSKLRNMIAENGYGLYKANFTPEKIAYNFINNLKI